MVRRRAAQPGNLRAQRVSSHDPLAPTVADQTASHTGGGRDCQENPTPRFGWPLVWGYHGDGYRCRPGIYGTPQIDIQPNDLIASDIDDAH